MDRLFIGVVGAIYLFLGIWCLARPDRLASSIGLSFANGSGRSEFLAVYGGLEIGLGAALLMVALGGKSLSVVVLMVAVIHGGIVLGRVVGFATIERVEQITYILFATEATTFVLALVVWWFSRESAAMFIQPR